MDSPRRSVLISTVAAFLLVVTPDYRGRWCARQLWPDSSLPVAKYAGRYTDAWYGDITISLENEKLVLRFEHFTVEERRKGAD